MSPRRYGASIRGTLGHVARRFAWALVVVVGVGTLSFFLERGLPGDPARLWLGPQASAADVERASRIWGFDQPLGTQYVAFWRRLLHRRAEPDDGWLARTLSLGADDDDHRTCAVLPGGLHVDLGQSQLYGAPVAKLLGQRAIRSLELALAALALQLVLGMGAGILAAKHRGRFVDRLTIGTALVGASAPLFVTGMLLQYLLAHELGWLPYDAQSAGGAIQLSALVLPALTLGVFGAALYARIARDELTGALASDYVRASRARGAGAWRALVVHALRNALLPIATLFVLDLGTLVGGAVVTEKLFRWPGLGKLAVDALVNRDGPLAFGTVLCGAAFVVLATLLLDLVYIVLDPRLRRPAVD